MPNTDPQIGKQVKYIQSGMFGQQVNDLLSVSAPKASNILASKPD